MTELVHHQRHRARDRLAATRRVFFRALSGARRTAQANCCSPLIIPYRSSWLDFEVRPKVILYFRVDRHLPGMPVTILLKDRLNPESILANFFVSDSFRLMDGGMN